MNGRSPQLWRTAWDGLPEKYQAVLPLNLVGSPVDLLKEVETQATISKGRPITLPNGSTFFVRDVLEKISHWIKRFVEVGDSAVQYDPGHAALPWAALRLLLQASLNNLNKHSAVLEGIDTISRWLVWGKIQESFLEIPPLRGQAQLEQSFVKIYDRMLTLMARSLRFLRKGKSFRMLASFFSSDSKFRTNIDEIIKAKSDLEAHIGQCSDQAVLLHTNEIRDDLDELRRPISRIEQVTQETLDAVRQLLEVGRVDSETILDWASQIPYEKHHRDTVRKALEGTGNWLFQDPTYYDWKNTSCSEILWLHGGAGFGKSTLISMLIRSLMDAHDLRQEPYPIYFYCSRNTAEPERGSAEGIMRSLMRQASDLPGGPPLHPSLLARYTKRRTAGDASIEDATEVIIQSIAGRPMTFIMIDALDECSLGDRELITDALEKILRESASMVKIFVTSRDNYIDISRFMTEYPDMQIDASRNQDDIELYVRVRVEEAVRKKKLLATETFTDDLREKVEKTLSDGANGMFRWVELQLEFLYTIHVRSVFVERLGKLPPTLARSYSDLYDLKMVELGESQASIVRHVLSWLLVAQRTLKTSELRELIFAASKEEMTNDTVLGICFDLVSIDIGQDQFRFAHPSVREFLEARPVDFKISTLHDMASSTCLDIIMGGSDYKFTDYAPLYWTFHAEASNRAGDTDKARQKQDAMLTPGCTAFSKWTKRMLEFCKAEIKNKPSIPRVEQVLRFDSHPFVLCASFGLVTNMTMMLTQGSVDKLVQMTGRTTWKHGTPQASWTALCLATRYQHFDAVRLLLDHGANPNSLSIERCLSVSPLITAVETGNIEIVRLLVERGAFLDANGGTHPSALHATAHTGSLEIAELLIEKGANVNLNRHVNDRTPLRSAVNRGNVGLAKLLIDRGATVNPKPDAYDVGMWNAAGNGNMDMVQLLLDHAVDVNIDNGAALRVASQYGQEDMVKFLLRSGADVNINDGAALCAAVAEGRTDIVELLIDNGADVNQGNGSALRTAAKDSEDVVRLLIDRGADVNLRQESQYEKAARYWSILPKSELFGLSWADRYLFDGSALQVASAYGQKGILELLLERGADVSLDDGWALWSTRIMDSPDVAEVLIKNGAVDRPPASTVDVVSDETSEEVTAPPPYEDRSSPGREEQDIASNAGSQEEKVVPSNSSPGTSGAKEEVKPSVPLPSVVGTLQIESKILFEPTQSSRGKSRNWKFWQKRGFR